MKPIFIHTSDIHLGLKLTNKQFSLKEREKRREELWDTFDAIIEDATNEKVKYMFIAGDMAEGEYLNFRILKRIIQKFKNAENIKFIITCGKSDFYNINSLYEYVEWPENVYFFKNSNQVQKIFFEEDNLCIYSVSCGDSENNEFAQLIYDISVDESKLNVLILHCSNDTNDENYINPDLVKNKFDYCAFGGNHNYAAIKDNVVYSGTPEPLSFEETKEHGIIKGTLEKSNVTYDFIAVAKRKFVIRNIEMDLSCSFNKILDLIKFSGDTISNIKDYIRVNLNGTVNADISIDEIKNEAKQFFYYIEFEENYVYKNVEENKYEDNDFNIIESYKLQFDNHENKLEQQAFELGLRVLRKEKVVR